MSVMKRCKVCGKEYEYCHTLLRADGVFRWQDVACSPECGSKYLAAVIESRKNTTTCNDEFVEDESEAQETMYEDDFEEDEPDIDDAIFEDDAEDE